MKEVTPPHVTLYNSNELEHVPLNYITKLRHNYEPFTWRTHYHYSVG